MRLKERWRNAPPSRNGLKPTFDLWIHLAARDRQAGQKSISEDEFWRQIVRSIREGFFDADREVYSIVEGKVRITSGFLRETLRWDLGGEDWPLLRAIVRDSWATIATLAAWAESTRSDVPPEWKRVLRGSQAEPEQEATKDSTKQAILKALLSDPKRPREKNEVRDERIAAAVSGLGKKTSARSVRRIREQQK